MKGGARDAEGGREFFLLSRPLQLLWSKASSDYWTCPVLFRDGGVVRDVQVHVIIDRGHRLAGQRFDVIEPHDRVIENPFSGRLWKPCS